MELKSNELRIGNWVNSTIDVGNNWDIVVTEGDFAGNYKKFNPITITQEWLIKFGFERRNEGTSDAWYIGFNKITHDWLFDLVWINDYQYPFYRNGLFTIKSVHQLQNLYHALTGEELQLKKTPQK